MSTNASDLIRENVCKSQIGNADNSIRHIYHPSPVFLGQKSSLSRKPTRPLQFQDRDFVEKYDSKTLIFDTFKDHEGETIRMICPPLNNLKCNFLKSNIRNMDLDTRVEDYDILKLDRQNQIVIYSCESASLLSMALGDEQYNIIVSDNKSQFFSDCRVIFTLSRNNDINWIKDWARYNRDVHGANAILFYDNNSDLYGPSELLAALASLSGFRSIVVVPWLFKYGPQGLGARKFWDSDYCQSGAWEHARRMFLSKAKSCLNSDIDELIVSADSTSLFEATENSKNGILRFFGRWSPSLEGLNDQLDMSSNRSLLRHQNFTFYRDADYKRTWYGRKYALDVCPPKWSVVPKRCPSGSQWRAHSIKGWLAARFVTQSFSYRHFVAINNNWKYNRIVSEKFDEKTHQKDDKLIDAFTKVNWNL